jgi:hypothetical protein
MGGRSKTLVFKDFPEFKPNLTPKQIFERGAFGGTYWRPIYSSITGKNYKNKHREFPFLKGVDRDMLTSEECDLSKNMYGVHSGTSLEYWEDKGWIDEQDPYGWVQWYCRFYQGRRTEDDERQIKRWLSFAGPNGRFRKRLVNMVKNKRAPYNDHSISPKIRQGLLHWAYELTSKDIKN